MSVIKLADKSDSGMHWQPEDVLVEALERVRNGEWAGRRKIIVLSIFDEDNSLLVSELQSGMKLSEELAVLEYTKSSILREMLG